MSAAAAAIAGGFAVVTDGRRRINSAIQRTKITIAVTAATVLSNLAKGKVLFLTASLS